MEIPEELSPVDYLEEELKQPSLWVWDLPKLECSVGLHSEELPPRYPALNKTSSRPREIETCLTFRATIACQSILNIR